MWEKSPILNMAGGGGQIISLIVTLLLSLVYSCTPYSYSKRKVTHWMLCVPVCCPCTDPEVYITQPRGISKYLTVLHYQLLVGNQLWQCVLTPGAQDQHVRAEYLHPCGNFCDWTFLVAVSVVERLRVETAVPDEARCKCSGRSLPRSIYMIL